MYAFSNAACTVAGGCAVVSAGFGASSGFASIPFGKVGFGFAVSAGFVSAGFGASSGFASTPCGKVGFGFAVSAGFVSADFVLS